MKIIRYVNLGVAALLFLTFGCSDNNNVTEPKDKYEHVPLYPELVAIPSGTFNMGQILQNGFRLGFPVHSVTLTNDFEMGKYEITNNEFCNMLNYALSQNYLAGDYNNNQTVKNSAGDSQELLDLDATFQGQTCEISFDGSLFVVESGKENRPVVYVSWYGCAFYCNMLSEQENLTALYDLSDWTCAVYEHSGYRLPTEAEWEYVARYDDERIFPWGDTYNDSLLNYNLTVGYTTDVGYYEAGKSKLGLYDMSGNVEEWVNDWYGTYTDQPQTNPTGPVSSIYKEKRGGGWYQDDNNFAYAAYRYDTNYMYTSYFDIGFRVVKIIL